MSAQRVLYPLMYNVLLSEQTYEEHYFRNKKHEEDLAPVIADA